MCFLLLPLRVKISNQCLSRFVLHFVHIHGKSGHNSSQCLVVFFFPCGIFGHLKERILFIPKICDKVNIFPFKNILGLQRPSLARYFLRLIYNQPFPSRRKKKRERQINKQLFRHSKSCQYRGESVLGTYPVCNCVDKLRLNAQTSVFDNQVSKINSFRGVHLSQL